MTIRITYALPADANAAALVTLLNEMSVTLAETAHAAHLVTQGLPFSEEPGDATDQLFRAMDDTTDAFWRASALLSEAAEQV